jgi:hypothetical protein
MSGLCNIHPLQAKLRQQQTALRATQGAHATQAVHPSHAVAGSQALYQAVQPLKVNPADNMRFAGTGLAQRLNVLA